MQMVRVSSPFPAHTTNTSVIDFTYQDILIATYPDNSILEVNGVNVQTSLDIVDALYKIKSWRIKGVTRESDKAIEICECQEHPMWKCKYMLYSVLESC